MISQQLQKYEVIREWYDELKAVRERIVLGLAGVLVSWSIQEDGQWMARVSGRGVAETVEAYGKSRLESIHAAEKEFARRKATTLDDLIELSPEA